MQAPAVQDRTAMWGRAGYDQELERMENKPMKKERKQFMKTCKPVLSVLAGVLTFACIATAADAPKQTFKFTTINVKGSQETDTYGINNAGVIVGDYIDSSGMQHGLMLAGKKVTNIDDPNATGGTICWGINSSGVIVGAYVNSSGNSQAFVYQHKKFTDIGPAGATYSEALGNNDKGEIVGDYIDSSGIDRGFLWNGKKYKTLDVSGSTFTLAHSINNSGLITIIWGDSSGNEEGALYDGKKYIPINVPGAVSSFPHKIDTAGDIVFSWYDSSGNTHAALCTKCTSKRRRKYYKFDDPKGPDNTRAVGINDHRTIVGRFLPNGNSTYESFRATY